MMEEEVMALKLFMITHMGVGGPCLKLRVAENPEEALMRCIRNGDHPSGINIDHTCSVQEVVIEGYELIIKKKE